MDKENVTKNQILSWLGSDNTLDEALTVIQWLANNEYTNDQLNSDIVEYNTEG